MDALRGFPHVIVGLACLIILLVMLPGRSSFARSWKTWSVMESDATGCAGLLGGIERQRWGACEREHSSALLNGTHRAGSRAIRRDRGTEVMPDHSRYGAVAKRRDQAQRVPDKVREAKQIKVAIVRVIPPSCARSHVDRGRPRDIPPLQAEHDFAPSCTRVPESHGEAGCRADPLSRIRPQAHASRDR